MESSCFNLPVIFQHLFRYFDHHPEVWAYADWLRFAAVVAEAPWRCVRRHILGAWSLTSVRVISTSVCDVKRAPP